MPRSNRIDIIGQTYHVMNRSVGRLNIFNEANDYLDFIRIIIKALEIAPVKIYAYCIMPNHWHLLVSPYEDGGVGRFMHAITNRHTRLVHAKTETDGLGPLYKGRYKSILVDSDEYFLKVMRYVERNAVRAKLSEEASSWRWCSAWIRKHGDIKQKKILSVSPLELCEDYNYLENYLNRPDEDDDLEGIRLSITKNRPFGRPEWAKQMILDYKL